MSGRDNAFGSHFSSPYIPAEPCVRSKDCHSSLRAIQGFNLKNFDPVDLVFLPVDHMNAARDAGVEGVDHPQDFQRFGRIRYGNAYRGLRTLIDQ